MKLIDTHSHVLKTSYKEDLENVIKEIQSKNMIVFNISFNIKSSREAMLLFDQYKFLIPVIGIHPVDTIGYSKERLGKIEKLINKDVAAIGEIGLDYHFDGYDKDLQKEAFIDQIKLAQKYNLPIVVHTRDSLEDCYEIIKNFPEQKFLLHSWSGDECLTKKMMTISDQIYFSYNGIITFKNAQLQKDVIKTIPLDRLMFETDCPYLSPVPFRGKTNYPSKVQNVIEYSAEILNITFDELMEINKSNALSFYNVDEGQLN